MIKLQNVTKRYHHNLVLDNITFELPKGSITGILGPNGAGKSTLIKIITGFEYPDSGKVFIKEKENKNFEYLKKYIYYLPEKMVLYPDYFVGEFLSIFNKISKSNDNFLLETLELKEVLNKKIKNLSKGWHQRLKLYVALSQKRKIAILDEPFDGFDPLQMRKIIKIINLQNNNGKTFVITTHQLSYAQKICNYFIFLDKGKLIESGTIKYLLEKYALRTNDLEEIMIKAIEK